MLALFKFNNYFVFVNSSKFQQMHLLYHFIHQEEVE